MVSGQFGFDQWTTANGLPQNSVNGIAQTPDGFLWLATFDGLARFDGVRFTIFDKGNSSGIINNRFRGIFADREGAVWAFTENGILTVYREGVFKSYETPEGLGEMIHQISEDENDRLIISTLKQLYYFQDEQMVPLPAEKQRVPRTSYSRIPGSEWIMEPGSVTHRKDGTEKVFRLDLIFPGTNLGSEYIIGPEFIASFCFEDSRGGLWFGGEASDLYYLSNDSSKRFTTADIFGAAKPGNIIPILEDEKGNIWISAGFAVRDSANAGLIRYDGKKFEYIQVDGVSVSGIIDRENNLWFTTIGSGLMRLQKRTITNLSVKDGLAGNEVYPLIQTRSGDIYIGTTLGVNLYRNGKLSFLDDLRNAGNNPHLSRGFSESDDGKLYISYYGGFGRIENDLSLKKLEKSVRGGYTDFEYDADGSIWLAGEEGLVRFREDQPIEKFTVSDGLPHNNVITLSKDRSGVLWIGTAKGLSKLEGKKFTNYGEDAGMPEDFIREIYEDADGALWIGTYSSGLVRYKDRKFFRYTVENGLFNNGVFAIVEDERGNFWMSCNRGIYRVSRKDLNDFADGKISRIVSLSYGTSDGMLSTEANGGRHPSALKARDGKIWFPTMGGVAIVDPNAETFNPKPPPVVIESVSIDRKKLEAPAVYAAAHDSNKVIEMQPGQTTLEISYTGVSLIKSDQVKFKYKLEGLDDDWVEGGAARTANYSYLPHGAYTFRVIAANASGVWNEQGAAIGINVLPFYYETWWFRALSTLIIAFIVGFIYYYRTSNLRKIADAKAAFSRRLIESQETERKRLAGELHDSLSQNLVIIKNRAMMSLAERENVDYAFEQIEEIADAASESLTEVREIAANLRPFQIDRLGLTKAIEALIRKANSAQLIVEANLDNIDKLLPAETEINLYRILQETLNNIVKHSGATGAKLEIKKSLNTINVSFLDNGKGFDSAANSGGEPLGGFGLSGMMERARIMGSVIEIDSSPEDGTEIRLLISY